MTVQAKTWLKVTIPILISVAVAAWLFHSDFNQEAFDSINFTPRVWIAFLMAIGCIIGRETGMAWRFRLLSARHLTWTSSFKVTMLCEFTSCITPTSVGGSAASMIFMSREGLSSGRATTITITTLFLDELFISLITPIIFLAISHVELFGFERQSVSHDLQVSFWIAYAVIVAWTIVLGIALFIAPNSIHIALVKLFSLPLIRRWKKNAELIGNDLVVSARELRSFPISKWFKAFCATTLSWISRFVTVNALIWGFVIGADQVLALGRQVIVWVLLMFTPTPGGSGVSEWIFKEYYSDIISAAATVMIIALLWRILTYYIYLFAGIGLLPSITHKKQRTNYE